MLKKSSIKFNMFMNFILTASSFLFPLITYPYVSRILQPDGMGKIAFATSIVFYFSMFAMLGIPVYGIRTCAKVREDKEKLTRVVHELLAINIVTSIISIIMIVISLLLVPKFQEYKVLILINSGSLILNVLGINWLYSAMEQYSYITIRSIIFKIISIILMFILIHEKSDYVIYAAIAIFASVGSNITNIINLRKIIYLHPVGDYNIMQHIKPILVFFSLSIAINIYVNLDTVMLGFMKGDTEVGLYNTSVKVKVILTSVVTSFGSVLLPRMSSYAEDKTSNLFDNLAAKALNLTLLISIPLAIYFMLYAKDAILLLSGYKYINAVSAMKIITPTIIFIGITNFFGIQVLVPLNREKQVLISSIVGALIDIILNYFLIPVYGSAGAAIGTLGAEISVFIVQFVFLFSFIKKIIRDISLKQIIISTMLAYLITSGLKEWLYFNSAFVNLAYSSLIYFSVYLFSLYKMKEPLTREVINNFKIV